MISEDGKRIAAQLGNADWGGLDASWTEKDAMHLVRATGFSETDPDDENPK